MSKQPRTLDELVEYFGVRAVENRTRFQKATESRDRDWHLAKADTYLRAMQKLQMVLSLAKTVPSASQDITESSGSQNSSMMETK